MSQEDVDVLQRWHRAVNAGDVPAALAECAEHVEVRGPRGTGHGHGLVRDWLTRSGIQLEPLEAPVETRGRFIVHETATWTVAQSEPRETYCVFTVANSKVTSIARYDDPAEIPTP